MTSALEYFYYFVSEAVNETVCVVYAAAPVQILPLAPFARRPGSQIKKTLIYLR